MPFCSKCGKLMWAEETHECPPLWLVWIPEDGEAARDAAPIGALDAEDAAERRVAKSDIEDGYPVATEDYIVTVCVAPMDQPENVRRFKVHGSMNPVYFGEEVEG